MRRLLPGVVLVVLALSPSSARAQQGRPYSLDDLKILIQGGLPDESILQRAGQNCLSFAMDDEAVRQLRAAGGGDDLLKGLRSACVRLPQAVAAPVPVKADTAPAIAVVAAPSRPAAHRVYSPGGEAVKSLFIPGLGQFGTRRPALGAVFLAGAGGALALGLLSQKVEVNCLSPEVNGACPSGQVRDQSTKRPMLVPGLAGFVGLGVISAIEAASGARRANARASAGSSGGGGAHVEWLPPPEAGAGSASVSWLRLRF